MKNVSRFDLEEQLIECWNVIGDIRLVADHIADSREFESLDLKDLDKILNLLLGLEHIYEVKFNRAFDTFEKLVETRSFPDA